MKERVREQYYKWKYLGFSKDVLEQYEERIALENLNLLQIMLWTTLVIIVLAEILLFWVLKLCPETGRSVEASLWILMMAMLAVIVQIVQNIWMKKKIKGFSCKTVSRFTTVLYLVVIDATAIVIEVIFYSNAYSTIVCGLFLISQILFISYPIDNFIYSICFVCVFAVLDIAFKEPMIYIYDMIDSVPFLIIGFVLSWRNSHARWELMIRSDHEKQLERENMENKLKESRIDVMLTQIQPHFIYNTLEGIGELCHENPVKAEQAVTEFSCFLRGNLSALNEQKMIPFEQELIHIKHYLFCEKMRFDERLNVEYDIQSTNFSIPTLSLQPLVENAVRYGVSRKEEGGTITIKSRENEKEWMILIVDDGCGFVAGASEDGKRKHIGIENVRTRLKEQCGGSLKIDSQAQSGTTVTIRLPKHGGE